jgi:hypothetical protein
MKFSITLSAIAVAFIGAVSAAPAPGTYASCNSNPAYKNLNIPSGYAVITAYDNNAANVSEPTCFIRNRTDSHLLIQVPGIQPGVSIAHCVAQCEANSE